MSNWQALRARGLHLVPFGGRCGVPCGCGGLDAAPVPIPRRNQNLNQSLIWGVELNIDLMMLSALEEHFQISGLRGR